MNKPDENDTPAEAQPLTGHNNREIVRPPGADKRALKGLIQYDREACCAEIFERIAEGETLAAVLAEDYMPGITVFFEWCEQSEAITKGYKRARQLQAHKLAADTIGIADDLDLESVDPKIANAVVNKGNLRVKSRQWLASKYNPNDYGEKIQQDITSQGESVTFGFHLGGERPPIEGEAKDITDK